MSHLLVRSRQKTCPVNLPLLRRLARAFVSEMLGVRKYDLGVYLVAAPEMAEMNRQFLGHDGSTDVITFPYELPRPDELHGEIFICIDEAVEQAGRFRSSWREELVRYLIHGILHLRGLNDATPVERRKMRRQEKEWLNRVAQRFPLSEL